MAPSERGNLTDKYVSGPLPIRWLTRRFLRRFDGLLGRLPGTEAPVRTVLEVGTGEGRIAERLVGRGWRVVALDLPDARLRAEWRTRPQVRFLIADGTALPFPNGAFDLTVCLEVLEHVADPSAVLQEIVRVTRATAILSVPREPLFRGSNLLALRYLRHAGNTPGHVQHWTTREFVRLSSTFGRVVSVRKPFPWTLVCVDLNGRHQARSVGQAQGS